MKERKIIDFKVLELLEVAVPTLGFFCSLRLLGNGIKL